MDQINPILLYDGSCGFCQRSVQFILAHERGEVIHFAPLDSEIASRLFADYPNLKNIDSIIFIKGNVPLVESDAVLEIAAHLRAPYNLAKHARIVPKPLRNHLYRLIAKNRHRILQSSDCCLLPTAAQRSRFLR